MSELFSVFSSVPLLLFFYGFSVIGVLCVCMTRSRVRAECVLATGFALNNECGMATIVQASHMYAPATNQIRLSTSRRLAQYKDSALSVRKMDEPVGAGTFAEESRDAPP